MKKLLVFATAAFLFSGVAFAHGGDGKKCAKSKECGMKEGKDMKDCKMKGGKDMKDCCKKDAKKKETKTAEKA
ncbi:MAG: hypothetical protein WAZ36_04215 [Sediminibacterium sp.]